MLQFEDGNCHRHELQVQSSNLSATQREDIEKELKEGMTVAQVLNSQKAKVVADRTLPIDQQYRVTPPASLIKSIKKILDTDNAGVQIELSQFDHVQFEGKQTFEDQKTNARISDTVVVMYNTAALRKFREHNVAQNAKNPTVKELYFLDGTGSTFTTDAGLTILSGYMHPVHKAVPLILAVHSGRNDKVYSTITSALTTVRVSNQCLVLVDFEKAESTAFCNTFPNAVVKGCYFHFIQDTGKHFDKLFGKVEMREKAKAKAWILEQIKAAHFSKTRDECMSTINNMAESLKQNQRFKGFSTFGEYFVRTWVKPSGLLEKWANFPLYMDPVAHSFVINQNDTNNFAERMVETFKDLLGVQGSNRVSVVEGVKLMSTKLTSTEVDIENWSKFPFEPVDLNPSQSSFSEVPVNAVEHHQTNEIIKERAETSCVIHSWYHLMKTEPQAIADLPLLFILACEGICTGTQCSLLQPQYEDSVQNLQRMVRQISNTRLQQAPQGFVEEAAREGEKNKSNLSQTNLSQLNLSQTNLSQTNLNQPNLSQTNPSLSQTNLSLSQTNLSPTNLQKQYLVHSVFVFLI